MSTIRKRKGKWQVMIRRKFAKQIIKTFVYEIDARKYALEKQSEMDKGFLVSYEEAQKTKFGDLLEHYKNEITAKKNQTIKF